MTLLIFILLMTCVKYIYPVQLKTTDAGGTIKHQTVNSAAPTKGGAALHRSGALLICIKNKKHPPIPTNKKQIKKTNKNIIINKAINREVSSNNFMCTFCFWIMVYVQMRKVLFCVTCFFWFVCL